MDVLVVEDDARMAGVLESTLTLAGYCVQVAHDGFTGLGFAARSSYDLLVLDALVREIDGFQIAHDLRQQHVVTPILFLVAPGAAPTCKRPLDAGATDYLLKPFAPEKLLSRVRALGRSAGAITEEALEVGDLRLDLELRQAVRGERAIDLTAKEFELLAYLMRNAGRVLSKEHIRDHVWWNDAPVTAKVVTAYMRCLRDKVDRDATPALLQTVRGVGYTIRA
jgi:two-component system response regulator MprA